MFVLGQILFNQTTRFLQSQQTHPESFSFNELLDLERINHVCVLCTLVGFDIFFYTNAIQLFQRCVIKCCMKQGFLHMLDVETTTYSRTAGMKCVTCSSQHVCIETHRVSPCSCKPMEYAARPAIFFFSSPTKRLLWASNPSANHFLFHTEGSLFCTAKACVF